MTVWIFDLLFKTNNTRSNIEIYGKSSEMEILKIWEYFYWEYLGVYWEFMGRN